MSEKPVIILIAELAEKDGIIPLSKFPGVWERKIDEHWTVIGNGHNEPKEYRNSKVAPFTFHIYFNGWPAGVIDPGGGVICAGAIANEETFCKALEKTLGGGE